MNKKIFAVLLCIALLLPVMAFAQSDAAIDVSGVALMNDGMLTVGCEIGYPPFEEFADDGVTPVGYDIEFAQALGDKLGLEVSFINTAWDGIFQGIDVNYDCVISAVTITEERKETMLFSDPYINNYQAVVVPADYEGEIASFLDLDGMTIALQKETTSDILISDYKDTKTIDCTISANEKIVTCFTQLTNGEVDAVVCDSTVAIGAVAADPDLYKIVFTDESEPEQFGVAMGLENTALQAAINQAIAELTEEGFFDELTAYWFGAGE
ncbi:MAG TPA: transporter substrate-binding domain-containing protein [Candidatus Limiplasma sp.]|nr:transporter substrate-binding domain-containing protein [Candidatus Limiplasma sp.]